VSAPTDLSERYGAAPVWRSRLVLGLVVVVAAAFLGWLGWTIWSQTHPQVQSNLLTYDVVDEHAARADVLVQLAAPDVQAACTLRAYAEDHSVVGELQFEPTASGRSERTVRTERRATSVELLGCTAPGQNRPR
jgi:hypothetical protein